MSCQLETKKVIEKTTDPIFEKSKLIHWRIILLGQCVRSEVSKLWPVGRMGLSRPTHTARENFLPTEKIREFTRILPKGEFPLAWSWHHTDM